MYYRMGMFDYTVGRLLLNELVLLKIVWLLENVNDGLSCPLSFWNLRIRK